MGLIRWAFLLGCVIYWDQFVHVHDNEIHISDFTFFVPKITTSINEYFEVWTNNWYIFTQDVTKGPFGVEKGKWRNGKGKGKDGK